MNAFYYWQSQEFNMMNVLSALSLSFNTTVENIYIYYDGDDHPANIYWQMLQFIPKVFLSPMQEKYKDMIHIKKPDNMDDVFKNSMLMNFLFMYANTGLAVSFDSFFLKDICAFKSKLPFFGNGDIYFGLLHFREKNCAIKRIMKKIAKKKYDYEHVTEYVSRKFQNHKNADVVWQHRRDQKIDKNKYIVDFQANEGFKLFDQDEFELFLNDELLAKMKVMMEKCKRTEKYFRIASIIHL